MSGRLKESHVFDITSAFGVSADMDDDLYHLLYIVDDLDHLEAGPGLQDAACKEL